MADSSGLDGRLEDSHAVELTGTVMVVIIIVLFFVVVLVLFFHLYAKWFLTRRNQAGVPSQGRRRRRFAFAAGYQEAAPTTALRRGLDPSVLKSIPVVVFHAREFKDGLECAVCLSDIAEGEKARLLPKCSHGFHVDCIDMWFQSHSTCPLCRNPVSTQPSSNSTASLTTLGSPLQENEHSHSHSESPNFPINTLFWGNQTQVNSLNSCSEEGGQGSTSLQPSCSTSSPSSSDRLEGALAIDIPRLINAEEEFKSPKSPATTRLKSFRRLLSRERRAVATPSSPNNIDVEQGACRDQS